ncbi:histidine kinase [Kitasatospora sp. NPDC057198]|uniref:sensor histidine kinase n=1 Tax=Kitasatospora sp. NPDC057198 TaxID=3346046 RepID=UPI00362DB2C8
MRLPVKVRRRLGRVRRHTAFLAAGIPVQSAGLFAALLVLPVPLLTAVQRRRFRALLGVEVPRRAEEEEKKKKEQGWARLAARSTWRQAAYHVLVGPLVAVGAAVVLAMLLLALAASTVLLWMMLLPWQWRVGHPGYSTQAGYLTAAGLAVLWLSARLADALTRADTGAAIRLLGPSRAEEMAQRIEDLSESRAGVVDAADLERRRIERDLHDGAQQRLVSMAVNLGLARATLGDGLSAEAREVIDAAHRDAKEAIAELNDLVRGLHPAVLEDRGLDAALSGIAARVPVPVRLSVDLPRRPSPAVEAVAYFVVSEALANVVKHARATRVDVSVGQSGGTLLLVVTDDGVGGADESGGTGLAGLVRRVASVDGRFSLSSPVGGPTSVTAELPCAR